MSKLAENLCRNTLWAKQHHLWSASLLIILNFFLKLSGLRFFHDGAGWLIMSASVNIKQVTRPDRAWALQKNAFRIVIIILDKKRVSVAKLQSSHKKPQNKTKHLYQKIVTQSNNYDTRNNVDKLYILFCLTNIFYNDSQVKERLCLLLQIAISMDHVMWYITPNSCPC